VIIDEIAVHFGAMYAACPLFCILARAAQVTVTQGGDLTGKERKVPGSISLDQHCSLGERPGARHELCGDFPVVGF
jgi:hypothetical protein